MLASKTRTLSLFRASSAAIIAASPTLRPGRQCQLGKTRPGFVVYMYIDKPEEQPLQWEPRILVHSIHDSTQNDSYSYLSLFKGGVINVLTLDSYDVLS